MTHPTVIVGAGPAGCALATWLAREGQRVVLLDAEAEPGRGVGESLIPQCAPLLCDLGVGLEGFVEKRGAVFTRGAEAARFDFAGAARCAWPLAWQVPRHRFDARLREVAVAAGAELRITRVTGFDLPGTVQTTEGPVHAGMVVDAAGRLQLLARHLGVRRAHPRLRNAAVTAWYQGVRRLDPEQSGDIVIASFDGGWFWVIPVDGEHASVGAVTTPEGPRGRAGFDEAVRRCAAVQARLEGASPIEALRGVSDFSCTSTAMSGPGWALVGDAATFLDPVFSTGVCFALHGARWLADALLGRSDLATYEARVRAAVQTVEPVVEAFYDGSFLDVAFSANAQQHEAVRRGIVSLLAGDIFDPSFATARRLAVRLPQLAQRVRATP